MTDAPSPRCSSGTNDLALCGVIADAIRDYCRSVSLGTVQNSHGKERIDYAGIDLQALAEAIFAALPGDVAQGVPVAWRVVERGIAVLFSAAEHAQGFADRTAAVVEPLYTAPEPASIAQPSDG